MIDQVLKAPRKLGYEEIEKYADMVVKMLSDKNMTYEQAWWVLKGHEEVMEEAIKHLNHNAAMEMRSNPIKFVL